MGPFASLISVLTDVVVPHAVLLKNNRHKCIPPKPYSFITITNSE
jgi:hypothetical protein